MPNSNYEKTLNQTWGLLPEEIKAMHNWQRTLTATGLAHVDHGASLIAKGLVRIFNFPAAGHDVPLHLYFSKQNGREQWRRIFAGRSFVSDQQVGQGRFAGLIAERIGPFTFGLALLWQGEQLLVTVKRWTLLGIPLPLAWSPKGHSYASVAKQKYYYHVEIGHALTGLIVRYQGWLDIIEKDGVVRA